MDNIDDWKKQVASKISKAEQSISPLTRRRYLLLLLPRLARGVAAFSSECEVCRSLQSQLVNISINIADETQITRQDFTQHRDVMKGIAKHLKRTHGLVEERQYVKRYVFVGLTCGLSLVLLGIILLSFGITLLALNITLIALVPRVVFGYTVGYFLDRRAKKQGRVF